MIFEIKLASKYKDEGIVVQLNSLKDLLEYIEKRVPVVDEFSPGVSIRPTNDKNPWQIVIYDNFNIEGTSER